MGKNIGKNIIKNLNIIRKLLDYTKQSAAFKTVLKREIQKVAKATFDLISNKIPNRKGLKNFYNIII